MISNFKDEWIFRIVAFIVVALGLFIWEKISPQFKIDKMKRKIVNFSLHFINISTVRLLLPGAAYSIALLSEKSSWGILRPYILGDMAMVMITVLILEWVIYLQHILFHKIPFLWRLHSVHHSDTSMDFTTALRFHPIEILISIIYKGLFIFFLGLPTIGVVVFEILLNSMAMFNHSNIRFPKKLEAFLRIIIVTPQMHRIHHSRDVKDLNTNFSFSFSIWDRLFKTYKAPALSQNNQLFGTGNENLDGQDNIVKLLLVKK